MRKHSVDPEPITIYLAILATLSGVITVAKTVEDHLPKNLPTKTRAQLLEKLILVDNECRQLQIDVVALRDLFGKAQFPNGRFIKLMSGARLSGADFARYERTSDNVYARLRHLNQICNDVEKLLSRLDTDIGAASTNELGDAHDRLDALLKKHDLSVDEAWQRVEDLVGRVEGIVRNLRSRLSP